MTQNELKKVLKITTVNQKIKSMVDYINDNNIDITCYDASKMNSKNVLEFINSMYSTRKTVELLFSGNNSILTLINEKPLVVANFYNIYDIEGSFLPLYDISVLVSNEYLKIVPIEWTRKYLFENNRYYLKRSGKGYSLVEDKPNFFDVDHNYVNIFDENIDAIENAKNEKELTTIIQKLSDAKI